MEVIKFNGFSVEAINQWRDMLTTQNFDPEKHKAALDEGLVTLINTHVILAPAQGGGISVNQWLSLLHSVVNAGIKLEASPAVPVCREFGNTPEFTPVQNPCAEIPLGTPAMPRESETEEHTAPIAEPVSITETAPETLEEPAQESTCMPTTPAPDATTENTPEVSDGAQAASTSSEPVHADNLRAKVGALPTYYTPLKEPLHKLIDLGADILVIDTAIDLAGKPYNLGQIASYARHILANAQPNRDLMTLVQSAHRAASAVENTSDANAAIMEKLMSYVPDGKKTAFKGRFEQHITDGMDKYWAEAWAQTEAALAAGRTSTPVNLFMNIVKDLERNTSLAEQRGAARINSFADCRWIMEYLPKNQIDYSSSSLNRGSRKFYLPKLKETIERCGYIPLTWVMTLLVDNDYPTRALTGIAEKMIEKYPALARIVTREQFDYAITLVAKHFLERANKVRESWDGDCSRHHLGTSLTHHAVYSGNAYVEVLADHAAAGMRFMDSLVPLLKSVQNNGDAMKIMADWHLDNPWKHGKTPEESYDHRKEEQAFNARSAAFRADEQRRQADLGTGAPE